MSKPKPWVKSELIDKNVGRFEVSPLDRGMGNTIGNALRRVLLSSLSGFAVTSLRIEGVTHEFTSIPNVVEDVMDIICNIKGIIFKYKGDSNVLDESSFVIKINANGGSKVTAGDIDCGDTLLQVVNKRHHVAELSDKGNLSIELVVEKGIGYRPAVMVKSDEQDVDHISIDASFSPVIRVNYSVDSVRVGEELGHDCLIIDVFVDGSISPDEAVKQSAGLLKEMLYIFNEINQKPEVSVSEVAQSDQKVDSSVLDMSVSDIELSARSSNCLKRAGIETVGALVSKDISELFEIKNFGKKSADEINGKLSQYNLLLKEDG